MSEFNLPQDPSFFKQSTDGVFIPTAEYFDGALSGWAEDDPYIQLAALEDAMAGRNYGTSTRAASTAAPDHYLFIRRPVVPSTNLGAVLEAVASFHNPAKETHCHKPGIDAQYGLHATLISTRSHPELELPDPADFDPARRLPKLGARLGKMVLEGATILQGSKRAHVVMLFGYKSLATLRREREGLQEELRMRSDHGGLFVPHVTLVSTTDQDVAKQALDVIKNRASIPRKIDLAPVKHDFCEIRYASAPI